MATTMASNVLKMCVFLPMIIFVLTITLISVSDGDVPRPRGVPLSKASLYQGGATFQCLDGSDTIPFNQVNDDYCDCDDGSDEPGTSACSNGVFQCTNAGHRPKNIVAAWVNDGICDCCDGTDEYDGKAQCDNYCKELGKAAREEAERRRLIVEEGHKIYLEYVKQGQDAMKEKRDAITELEERKEKLRTERDNLQALKEEAEIPEKDAKEAHKQAWEAEKQKAKDEAEHKRMTDAFAELDIDEDNLVSISEMIQHTEFDIDNSGDVSIEEAKEYLEDNEAVNQETFESNIWGQIKDIYKPLNQQHVPDTTTEPPYHPDPASEGLPPEFEEDLPPVTTPEYDEGDEEDDLPYHEDMDDYDEDEDYDRDDYDDFDHADLHRHSDMKDESKEVEEIPPYDEQTNNFIKVADEAREAYRKADDEFSEAEKEFNEVNKFLSLDLGANDEYYPLKGQCYEITDSQYTYKLCPFDRVTQKPKNGGAETSLGTWGHWAGPADNKYAAMKFERGQGCWQGPDRSTMVTVSCDKEARVHSPAEPSRCEYELKFTTPAACVGEALKEHKDYDHDEL